MSRSADRLYQLLPTIYRLRDAEQGEPLRALLRVIAEQVGVVEDDIAQLYDNWFIETCQDWAVPYIGELIGFQPVHEAGDPGGAAGTRGQRRSTITIPRRAVANTIRYRRAKGTLALLEQLAGDMAGWPARAVEFYQLLGWTQHINYQRLGRARTLDLRQGDALDLLGSPFEQIAHTVDIRRASSHRSAGRFNIPSIGMLIWRLGSYSVTQTPAYCLEEIGPQCFTFSVLGNEMPLYIRPERESEPTQIAEELNVPAPIRRRAFEERVLVGGKIDHTLAAEQYYGLGKSVAIWAPDWPKRGAAQPIPREAIIPADLSNWQYRPARNFVAVDPVLGRIVFPANQLPRQGVRVSYQYGFSADMGGGEYERVLTQPAGSAIYRVGASEAYGSIKQALAAWDQAKRDRPDDAPEPLSAVIEIAESGVYTEQLNISLLAHEQLQIRAASRARPVIRLLDYMAERPDAFSVVGGAGSRFTLDGLLVAGRGLRIYKAEPNGDGDQAGEDLCDVTIRHCTLVPGWALGHDCEPKRPNEPSIELANTSAALTIQHSIVGTIVVTGDQLKTDPNRVTIADSIVDATDTELVALGAPTLPLGFMALTIARTTVIGLTQVHAIDLAENSIFYGQVRVGRRQRGCMRFCWLPPGSRTPRRFSCQPELAEAAAEAELRQLSAAQNQQRASLGQTPIPLTDGDIDAAGARARTRVRPQFNSLRYGTPTYCQLAATCAAEITRGADDESELGAFHDLYQPQRAANLRAGLDEYTPAGMDAGIFYAS